MASKLSDLPVEMVERIVDYLPHRDTLLHLRLACRNLNAKTLCRFGKAYLSHSVWDLEPPKIKALTYYSNMPSMAFHVGTVLLTAPRAVQPAYENIWAAKGADPVKLGRALSRFPHLFKLGLQCFHIYDSEDFLHDFVEHLWIQQLKEFEVTMSRMKAADVVLVLKRHRKTLNHLDFEALDLRAEPDEEEDEDEDMELNGTPWSDVFEAMKKIKNDCEIEITTPRQFGKETLMDMWESWEPTYVYRGLVMDLNLDDPDQGYMNDPPSHLSIHIEGDSEWRKGVDRVDLLYSYAIRYPDRDGTPPWLDLSDDEVHSSVPGWCKPYWECREKLDKEELENEKWDEEDKAKLNVANEK
jgi:hypothetical protein